VRAASDQSQLRHPTAPGYDRSGRKTEPRLQEEAHNPRSPRSKTGYPGTSESQNCIAGCFLSAVLCSSGENSRPTIRLNGNSAASSNARPFPDPKIYERVVFKRNVEARQNMLEPYRLDSGIVIPVNPVRAGNVEIAEIGPSFELAIRVNAVLQVKLAGLDIRTQRVGCAVLPKKMNRSKKAPAKAGHEAALPQRLLNSGDHRSRNSWH
jgi:hypothetical protein